MADPTALKPTGRRVRGYISDLVELSGQRALWTAVVYHDDYRGDPALEAAVERFLGFLAAPGVSGVCALESLGSGLFLYATGEVRCARELIGAARGGIGWRAAIELFSRAGRVLFEAQSASARAAGAPPSHGSLDPHRVLVDYDGGVQILGLGLPRLDLLDFLDDPSLLPPAEAVRFTAPESLEGAAEDLGTDLFSLASLAIELATGRPLYEAPDLRALLALAADGDGRRALRARELPAGVEDLLGPLLEPWPDDRPKSFEQTLARAEALAPGLPGDALGPLMESLAETASDVELDLPAGWALPGPWRPAPRVDPAALDAARERARQAASRAHAAARKAGDRLAAFDAIAPRDATARGAQEEAQRHLAAALSACAEADRGVAEADAGRDLAAVERAAELASDAAERALGAASEAERASDRASRAEADAASRQALLEAEAAKSAAEAAARVERESSEAAARAAEREALAARVAALAEPARAAASLADEAAVLAPPEGVPSELGRSLNAAQRAGQEAAAAARDAVEALGDTPDESSVREAERAVRAAQRDAKKALDAARAAHAQLEREAAARAGRLQALDAAADALRELAREALAASERGREALEPLASLEHHATAPVADAARQARRAATEASDAADALARIELEPEDDPDAVLDAARTHLESATRAANAVISAVAAATRADAAESERLAERAKARQQAVARHRAALLATGERVEAVVGESEAALARAEADAEGLDTDDVSDALAALRAHVTGLALRRTNWRAMAEPASEIDDPDELEGLVHTGLAEAGFAETDAAELAPRVAAVQVAIAVAREAIAAARAAREEELGRGRAVREELEREQAAVAALQDADPLSGEARDEVLSDPGIVEARRSFDASIERFAEAISEVLAALAALEDERGDADAAEGAGADARRAAAACRVAHRSLVDVARSTRSRVDAAAEARRAAAEAARHARAQIDAALAEARVELGLPDDEGVLERVQAPREAFARALAAVPADVAIDIDADPHVAREVLLPLAKQAIAAAREVRSAHATLERALGVAVSLVAALRAATARAEAAADRAAATAAGARALTDGLDGPWPEVRDGFRELSELIAVVDEAAARATAEADAAGEAPSAERAEGHADAAEAACAVAEEAFREAGDRAEQLRALVGAAREQDATRDAAERERALAGLEPLRVRLDAERARLDAAVQRAATSLADSPAHAARVAWDQAEVAVDRAASAFERAEAIARAVREAATGEVAIARLADFDAQVAALGPIVAGAAELAERAAEVADAERAVNQAAIDAISALCVEIENQVTAVDLALAEARAIADTLGTDELVEPIARIEEQRRHVGEARAQVEEARLAAAGAVDGPARDGAARRAKTAAERANAAGNTAVALQRRVGQIREAHAERERARRQKAIDVCGKVLHATTKRVDAVLRAVEQAEQRHAGWAELDPSLAALRAGRDALTELLDGARAFAAAGAEAERADIAEDALDRVQTAAVAVDERGRALQRAIEALEEERAAAEASRAAEQARVRAALADARTRAEADLARARTLASGARERLDQARATAGATVARGASSAFDEASAAVDAAVEAVGRADAKWAELQAAGDALDEVERGADALRAIADEVRDIAATVEPSLATALRSARALAGILDEATAVRHRHAGLRERLASAQDRLALATRDLDVPRVLAERDRALAQLDELEQSMVEADVSLRELGEATSADEARALLEVAVASLDIAASVFELAMPVVDRAVEFGEAESRARREREEALQRALARIASAADVPPDDEREATLRELEGEAVAWATDARVEGALARARAAWMALVAARAELLEIVSAAPAAAPTAAEQQAEVAEAARERVNARRVELVPSLDALSAALSEVVAEDAARRERIEQALARRAVAIEALARCVEDAQSLRDDVATAAAAHPTACADALRALDDALERARGADPGEQPDPEDEASVAQAALAADLALEGALSEPIAALAAEVRSLAEAAEGAAVARAEALERSRAARREAEASLVEHVAALDAGLSMLAELAAENPTLDAWTSELAAARAALPEPDPAEDEGEPERADELASAARRALDAARALDPSGWGDEARARIDAARAEQERREGERAAARERHDGAVQRLEARRAAGIALREELASAAELPESESAWNELDDALAALAALEIPPWSDPDDPAEAHAEAARAEAVLATPLREEELADAVRQAVDDAAASRSAARARIEGARDMLRARLDAIDAALAEHTGPDAPPVNAARSALEQLGDALRGAELPEAPPEGASTAALRKVADRAERVLAEALSRDVAGLVAELRRAIDAARSAAHAEEAARAETQAAAIATLDEAVDEIGAEVDRLDRALAAAPTPAPHQVSAASHRAAASGGIARARAAIEELRALRGRLSSPVRSEIAIAIAFDAEMVVDTAREAVAEATGRLTALDDELARLSEATERVSADLEQLLGIAAASRALLVGAPEPQGESAIEAFARVEESVASVDRQVQAAQALVDGVRAAGAAREAEGLRRRFVELLGEARGGLDRARALAAAGREATERHLERAVSARLEAVSAARERARLAAERAGSAIDDVVAALESASAEVGRWAGDDEVGEHLTAIARANDRALQFADAARAEAAEVEAADDPEPGAERARALADEAEALAAEAREAVAAIRARVEALESAARAESEQAARERLARRDAALPGYLARLDAFQQAWERVAASAAEVDEDAAVELARSRASAALTALATDIERAREALALLEGSKPDDVEDFARDVESSIQVAGRSAAALAPLGAALDAERASARQRRAELEVEEHRGRCWEACKALQAISADLTSARSALGELPETPSAPLREGLDRLAEVERRLWRAGQRAAEARERAGSTTEIAVAREAAEVAEKALGNPGRWEREIDAALQRVAELVRAEPAPDGERIRQLRRGRAAPPDEDAHERLRRARDAEPVSEPMEIEVDNPTEQLLRRLRHGRTTGETGRERLRRLREQRPGAAPDPGHTPGPVPLDLVATPQPEEDEEQTQTAGPQYGGIDDYDDMQPTRIAKPETPPPAPDRRAELMERLRGRARSSESAPRALEPVPIARRRPERELPEEEGRTQMFTQVPKDEGEDAATQMFSREMLDEFIGDDDDDD